ncbi:MAG: response regulator [Gemmatimonadaceae bacterium]|nr:response regulator [Gemmatimonadaceae bacterium]NUQ92555.1 response regulator [Gemmatimonadaceae bacterium]NUR18780.1 response regulator [Gemmatimonadaceae bacterium]
MRVVLAEDSVTARRLLEAALVGLGHTVAAAGDGESAWRAFEQEPAPLVILDWHMPVLDGLEVCRRVRASSAGAESYVLMVTGRDADDDLATALEAGVDDYVIKPISQAQLRARVVLAERRLALAAAHRRAEQALVHAQWLAGIGETVTAVQHQINNPLFAAVAHLGLAAESDSVAESREHIGVAKEQLARIGALMRSMSTLGDPRSVEYLGGKRMIDLSGGGQQ